MPPSGYIKSETDNITSFLESNKKRFVDETVAFNESPNEGIQRELKNIKAIAREGTAAQRIAVLLSGQMYERISETPHGDWESFDRSADEAIQAIAEEILSVKLPE